MRCCLGLEYKQCSVSLHQSTVKACVLRLGHQKSAWILKCKKQEPHLTGAFGVLPLSAETAEPIPKACRRARFRAILGEAKAKLIASRHVDSGALSSRLFLTAAVVVARKGCCRHQVPFCVSAQAEAFNSN